MPRSGEVPVRRCSRCREELPLDQFYDCAKPTYTCIACTRERVSLWQRANRPRLNARVRARNRTLRGSRIALGRSLRAKHRVDVKEYEEMLRAQGGVCALCGYPETKHARGGGVQRLSVDHDRACCPGDVSCGECTRGLLCHSCNMIEGSVRKALATGLLTRVEGPLAVYRLPEGTA